MFIHNDFYSILKERLSGELPGDEARNLMAPSLRVPSNGLWKFDEPPIQSAVCILLHQSNGKFFFPLIKRASGNKHGGQIALPGGKYDFSDKDILETALRETHEEIGVRVSKGNVLGKLSSLYVPVSNYMITPYVAFSDDKFEYQISKYEVQFVMEAYLNEFFCEKNKGEEVMYRGEFDVLAPYYKLQNEKVWGATAMILSEFERVYGDVINKL